MWSIVCPSWRRQGAKAQEHQVLKVWITNTGSRLRRIIPGTLCLFQLMTLSSVDTSRTHASQLMDTHTHTLAQLNGGCCFLVPQAANYWAFHTNKRERLSPFKHINPSIYRLQQRWLQGERAAVCFALLHQGVWVQREREAWWVLNASLFTLRQGVKIQMHLFGTDIFIFKCCFNIRSCSMSPIWLSWMLQNQLEKSFGGFWHLMTMEMTFCLWTLMML